MKKFVTFTLAIALITSMCIYIFADGIDGPKKEPVGCATPASTTPADWAKEDVEKAIELGIIDKDTTYYYGSYITREEFCEIIEKVLLVSNLDSYKTAENNEINPFTDTENQAVIKLNSLGIIKGKSETEFAPADLLTREEAAVIFSRVITLYPDTAYTELYFEYDDEENISSWAKNAVQIMYNTKIMEGYAGVFYPKSILSTEEAVAMVMRFYRYVYPEAATFADNLNAKMPTDKNYMFSPLSIKMALALAANGAEGETKTDILNAMLINDIDDYNKYSKDLIEKYSQSDKLTLKIANSVWVNTDNSPHDFRDEYKDTVSAFYDATADKVNNENAVQQINGWVNNKTNGKIPSIIEDTDFWAALINAIYFKGTWENEFPKSATKPDTFHSADGTTKEIDFMNQTDSFAYSKKNNTEIVKMPYKTSFYTVDENGNLEKDLIKDTSISMYLIKNPTQNAENDLQEAEFTHTRIKLSVPKFEIEYSEDITKLLKLGNATSRSRADFTGMMNLSPDEDLWIDKVLHKTYIKIDEEGTEAAAVTAVMMAGATSSRPKDPIEVKFDEPFCFVIRDDTNGEILFMGRYAFPE